MTIIEYKKRLEKRIIENTVLREQIQDCNNKILENSYNYKSKVNATDIGFANYLVHSSIQSKNSLFLNIVNFLFYFFNLNC